MDAPPPEFSVMVCLPVEERQAETVLAYAARLSQKLKAPLVVVHVYPADRHDSEEGERLRALTLGIQATCWHLSADDPAEPLRRFVIRRRITHLVLGAEGRRKMERAIEI